MHNVRLFLIFNTLLCSSTTLWPQGFSVKVRNPAHHLIEEWMIVANQSVARFLFGNFIKRLKGVQPFEITVDTGNNNQKWLGATLRNHSKPDRNRFSQLVISKTLCS